MKRPVKAMGALSAVLLLILCVFAGSVPQSAPSGEALTGETPLSAAVLFFEPFEDTELFAYRDDVTYVLATDGSRACETAYPGHFGFVRGNAVSIVCLLEDFTAVQRFDTETLTQTDFFGLEGIGSDVKLAECDALGRIYAVTFSDPCEIFVFDAAGSYAGSLLYDEPVSGLQILGGTLYVLFRDHGERIALGEAFPQAGGDPFFYAAHQRPTRMLTPEIYVNMQGCVCTIGGTVLLDAGVGLLGAPTVALDGDSVLWASDASVVSKLPLGGGTLSTHPVRGGIHALTPTTALSREDGVFYRTVLGDFTVQPTPTPEPTAAPETSASPKPTAEPEEAPVEFSGTFMLSPEGLTCAKLRLALAPHEVQIYTESMSAAAGRLRTGMILSLDGTLYTVAVRGDVSGSGTVNSADVRLLQQYLAGDKELGAAACLAADLNGDGEATAADLVLLAAQIGAKP